MTEEKHVIVELSHHLGRALLKLDHHFLKYCEMLHELIFVELRMSLDSILQVLEGLLKRLICLSLLFYLLTVRQGMGFRDNCVLCTLFT